MSFLEGPLGLWRPQSPSPDAQPLSTSDLPLSLYWMHCLCLFWIFRIVESHSLWTSVAGLSTKHGVCGFVHCSSGQHLIPFHTLYVASWFYPPPPPIPMYSMKWGKLAVVWFSVHAFSLYPLWSLLRGPAVAPFLSTNLLPVSQGSRPRTEGVPSCRSGLCRCPGICGLTSGAGRREEGRGQFSPWGFPGFT